MERIVREGAFDFGKDDFLRVLPEIKKLALKKSTIRSGFRDTGIVPFNPNHVLETMGQWVYEHKLTVEQEVAQWQPAGEVFEYNEQKHSIFDFIQHNLKILKSSQNE
jgi:hypothetical protein